jgi:AcrR family transcriptional regulator
MNGDEVAPRPVGRPRQYDDASERRMILDAAYTALRDHGHDFTIGNILTTAGVSTRSFYRHFTSKDALLCAMYRRDAEWAAQRVAKRLAEAASPIAAVIDWIDEIFGFVGDSTRAERVAVLGSITGSRTEEIDAEAARARQLLIEPLRSAIESGVDDGVFESDDPALHADLIAAAVMRAAGLSAPFVATNHDQAAVTEFCLRALRI